MASIQEHLDKIKNAIFGKDVRQAIHDSIKQCYDDAAVNHDNANMEVKLARGSHNTLNDRLVENEKNQEKISSQLEHKANENDLEVERKRIDSFTKLEEGSTTGDAELIDGRIGENSITYENIGDSIRTQLKNISDILKREYLPFINGYYVDKNGDNCQLPGWGYVDFTEVNKGDIIQITSLGYQTNVSAVYLYDINKNKIKPLQISSDKEKTYTIFIEFNGYIKCSSKITGNTSCSIVRVNKESLNTIENYENNISLNLLDNVNWNFGSYVNYIDGSLGEHDEYCYLDYIDISDLNDIKVNISEYYQYLGCVAFYDENKNFIDSIHLEGNQPNPNLGQIKEIQLKGHYMRITCMIKHIPDFKLFITMKQLVSQIKHVGEQVDTIKNEFNFNLKFNWIKGSYILSNTGEVVSLSNDYSYTDFIDISEFTNCYVDITEYYDWRSGIAFYDENKNFISGISCDVTNSDNPNLGQIVEIQLKGHYMRLTCKTKYIDKFRLYTSFKQIVKTINNHTYEMGGVINPCFYTGNLNLIKMFNKVACIGDSYTEGAIEYKTSDGRTLQSIDSRYSYPTQLSKIANIQTVNLGHAGYTTTQWYNKYKDIDLSGYDCAIIWLSINDWFNGKVFQKEQYVNIINKLRTDNKNIPIFCITNTKNYLTTAYTFNEEIKEVAINNNCYIIDLGEYSDWTPKSKWLNGSHPNAYGYYHNAEMINSYINYIIENNKADFYNLSFVGTDKIDF